jgi:plastocyanin
LRKLLVPVAATAAAAAAVLAPPALGATNVKVGDNYFVRPSGVPTVTVVKDTVVTWVWKGRALHNVKVFRGPVRFGSSSKKSGKYRKKLTKRGTYTLYCSVHGADDQSMKLVVK